MFFIQAWNKVICPYLCRVVIRRLVLKPETSFVFQSGNNWLYTKKNKINQYHPHSDEDGVIGVAELCNKQTNSHFTTFDEEMAMAFSSYCGLAILHRWLMAIAMAMAMVTDYLNFLTWMSFMPKKEWNQMRLKSPFWIQSVKSPGLRWRKSFETLYFIWIHSQMWKFKILI